MQNIALTHSSSAPLWKRLNGAWHLIVAGETVARLVRNHAGRCWLSRIDRPDEDGWSSVDFLTLKHGKQCLLNWWASRPDVTQPRQ